MRHGEKSKNLASLWLLVVCILLGIQEVNGQLLQKTWMVGGSGRYQRTKYTPDNGVNQKSSSLELNPKAGYFFIDKFSAGIQLSYNRQQMATPFKSLMNAYGFGPFARYYFLAKDKRWNLLSELGFLYNITSGDGTNTLKNVEYSFKVGPTVFLNSAVALEALLGQTWITEKNQTGDTKLFNIHLGFQIYLDNSD